MTCAPFNASAWPSPVRVFTPVFGEAATAFMAKCSELAYCLRSDKDPFRR